MKTVRLFLAVVLSGAFGTTTYGQTVTKALNQQKTETFKVLGNCDL